MTFEYQLHTIERIKHTQHQPHARIFVRNSRVGYEHPSIVTVMEVVEEEVEDVVEEGDGGVGGGGGDGGGGGGRRWRRW